MLGKFLNLLSWEVTGHTCFVFFKHIYSGFTFTHILPADIFFRLFFLLFLGGEVLTFLSWDVAEHTHWDSPKLIWDVIVMYLPNLPQLETQQTRHVFSTVQHVLIWLEIGAKLGLDISRARVKHM